MKKLVAESLEESLTPSGAVFGFAAWLTSRDEPIILSAHHDAAEAARLASEFIDKQKLDNLTDDWEKDLVSMNESSRNYDDIYKNVKNSRKLPKEMKENIEPLIIKGDTYYLNGKVYNLNYPKYNGCSLGADKNGFFVHTHRARSKSFSEIDKIPQSVIKRTASTG